MWSVAPLAALPSGEGVTGTYVIGRAHRAVLVRLERTQSFDLFGNWTQLHCSQVCSLVTVRTGAVMLVFIGRCLPQTSFVLTASRTNRRPCWFLFLKVVRVSQTEPTVRSAMPSLVLPSLNRSIFRISLSTHPSQTACFPSFPFILPFQSTVSHPSMRIEPWWPSSFKISIRLVPHATSSSPVMDGQLCLTPPRKTGM